MYVLVYNKEFNQIDIIDTFDSLIWTKRYGDCGDFEMSILLNEEGIPDSICTGYYVSLSEDHEDGYFMIIENIEIAENTEDGNTLTISGRSLEAILDYRIIWDKIIYENKTTWYIIKDLIVKNITNPTISERKIQNFIIEDPSEDMTFSSISAEYDEDDYLLTAVKNNCDENHHSFSVRFNISTKQFVFKVYTGEDRSYDQNINPIIIFSPELDTMLSSKYLESIKNYKNVVKVINNGSNFTIGDASGINRKECKETVQNVTNVASLKAIGNIILRENDVYRLLEADVTNNLYVYGVDYFIGDIVQLRNSYSVETKARIIEMIYSQNTSGEDIYPTFKTIA